MDIELTKPRKKTARALVDMALECECAAFVDKLVATAGKPLRAEERPNHSRYLELYKQMHAFDKHLGDRYVDMRVSMLINTIFSLLLEGTLREEDLDACDPQMREEIIRVRNVMAFLARR